jgi:hypothetical protein
MPSQSSPSLLLATDLCAVLVNKSL